MNFVGVGWGAPLGGSPGSGWDWWTLVGFVVVFLAALRFTRVHVAVAVALAAIAGAILGSLTDSIGVVPVWCTAALMLFAASISRGASTRD